MRFSQLGALRPSSYLSTAFFMGCAHWSVYIYRACSQRKRKLVENLVCGSGKACLQSGRPRMERFPEPVVLRSLCAAICQVMRATTVCVCLGTRSLSHSLEAALTSCKTHSPSDSNVCVMSISVYECCKRAFPDLCPLFRYAKSHMSSAVKVPI